VGICIFGHFCCFNVPPTDEYSVADEALKYMSTVLVSLDQLVQTQPVLSAILGPVGSWLKQEIMSLALSESPSPNVVVDVDNAVINVLLYNVQSLLDKCPLQQTVDSSNEADHYIRNDARMICDITNHLNLPELKHHLFATLTGLLRCSSPMIHSSISSFLPFLERYLHFVEEQLITHTYWVKALFKLNLVLSSVMNNVSKDGFCKPPESEEDGSGDSGNVSELVDGTGLGEGTGNANISEEIEDESQVEGLQGEEEQGENDHKGGDDNTIEISEDLGGDMDDVPETCSQDSGELEEQGQDNLNEEIGNLDPSDPSLLDEKLWGDDARPDTRNDRADKTDGDHSTTKDATSEIVGREGSQSVRDQDLSGNADGDDADEQPLSDDIAEKDDNQPEGSGAPIDDYIQDANTLDLPDDLNLGTEEKMQDDSEEWLEESNSVGPDDLNGEAESLHNGDSEELKENAQEQNVQEMESLAEDQADDAIAQPDISSGDGAGEIQAGSQVKPSATHSATEGCQPGDSTAAEEEQEKAKEKDQA
jgi:midasin